MIANFSQAGLPGRDAGIVRRALALPAGIDVDPSPVAALLWAFNTFIANCMVAGTQRIRFAGDTNFFFTLALAAGGFRDGAGETLCTFIGNRSIGEKQEEACKEKEAD